VKTYVLPDGIVVMSLSAGALAQVPPISRQESAKSARSWTTNTTKLYAPLFRIRKSPIRMSPSRAISRTARTAEQTRIFTPSAKQMRAEPSSSMFMAGLRAG